MRLINSDGQVTDARVIAQDGGNAASASIGAGAIIMPGVTIGRQAMVGAGALVLHDVPDFATVYTKAETIIKPC